MYNNLNQKLSELQSGNYLIKVKSIGDRRPNKFYSKEYFVTVKYQVTDLNNLSANKVFERLLDLL